MKKNKLELFILLFEILAISIYGVCYFYSKDIINTNIEYLFIFFYFFMICLLLFKFLVNKVTKINRIYIALSVILAIIFVFTFFDYANLVIYTENTVKITALGEKNEESNANEVWITGIKIDDTKINLADFTIPESWFIREESIVTTAEYGPTSLILELPKANYLEISFLCHSWSGFVELEFQGGRTESYDLYSQNPQDLVLKIDGNKVELKSLQIFSFIVFFVIMKNIIFVLISSFKKSYIARVLAGILSCFLLFNILPQNYFDNSTKLFLTIIQCISLLNFDFKINITRKWNHILYYICIFYTSFLIFGSSVFIISDLNIIKKIFTFLLCSLWSAPVVKLFMYIFTKINLYLSIKKKIKYKKFNKMMTIIGSIVISLVISSAIYQIAFFDITPCRLQISSSGNKNEKALGYEVLIDSIVIDGKNYEVVDLCSLPEGWMDVNGTTIGIGENSLELFFEKEYDIKIIFNKHQWSGIVNIIDGNKEINIDLYSDSSTSYLKTYQVNSNKIYTLTFSKFICIFSIFLLIFAFFYMVLYNVHCVLHKKVKTFRFTLTVFLVMVSCFMIYFLASFPASICVDGRNQLEQIFDLLPLTDAHPAAHTLLVKGIINITQGVFGVALFQTIILSLFMASIFSYLYYIGIQPKVLLLLGVFTALCINNGIYTTILWKDILYTYSLMFLCYLIYRTQTDILKKARIANIIIFICILSSIYLFRHNGIVSVLFAIIYLLYISIKRKNLQYVIIIAGSIASIALVKGPIYKLFEVDNTGNITNSSATSTPLLHGLVYAEIEGKISDEAKEMLESIMLKEEWDLCYNPYSFNELYMTELAYENNVTQKILEIGLINMLECYIKTLPTGFWQLIQDRLTGTDLLWNVFRDRGYNWRVANDSYEIGVVSNDFGLYRHDNWITNILKQIMQFTADNQVLDAIFWRSGIWLLILGNFVCYLLITEKKTLLAVTIPCIGNTLSLLLSMGCQDYRYVYYMGLCVPIIVLLCLSYNKEAVGKGECAR